MALTETLEAADLLDRADASGRVVAEALARRGLTEVHVSTATGERGATDFLKVVIPGNRTGRTLGLIGRLGGVGARPALTGLVSDADGAIVAIASALKLARMKAVGDALPGTVIITTNICPNAPTRAHDPAPRMASPVDTATKNRHEVDPRMDAIVSVDATKANDIFNVRGTAITPTVKEGWVLRVSPGLAALLSHVTGLPANVLPITSQDVTPPEIGVYHINSIVQPSLATNAPVIGLAITSASTVAGSATGASHMCDLEVATRSCVEVAKAFTSGRLDFFDPDEWAAIQELYGPLERLRHVGGEGGAQGARPGGRSR